MRNIRAATYLAFAAAFCMAFGSSPGSAAAQDDGVRIVGSATKTMAQQEADRQRARTKLKIDDGSAEQVLSLTNSDAARTFQAVILNRFTPTENRLPLQVETISILFPKTCQSGDTGLRRGMNFEALVYLDPSGSGDPDNAMLVSRQPFEVQPSDTRFQKIDLDTPVTVTSGDVWIGYTNTVSSTDDRLIYHAALDTSSPSQGRSWLFFNGVNSNFDGDVLSNAQFQTLVDDKGIAGNWMIRARGRIGS